MRHIRHRRSQFFNLLQIQMPVGALTSITHRVTGILLALGGPFMIYLLDLSLQSSQGYAQAIAILDRWFVKCGAILLVWSLAHHLLAGIRQVIFKIRIRAFCVNEGDAFLPQRFQ